MRLCNAVDMYLLCSSAAAAAPGSPGDDPNSGGSAADLNDEEEPDTDPLPVDGEDDVLRGRNSFLRQKGKMIGRLVKASESLFNALKAGFSSDVAAYVY